MRTSFLCHVALLALLPVGTWAQLAPAASAPAAAPNDRQVVKLNVFEVNATNDDEYRAANTTTGTRYNTPVKDLPMNIEVLTTSFMRDIGAVDLRDALGFVSGIQLDTTAGGTGGTKDNPENNTLLIRGIAAATNKDGFRRFVPVDPITISRADIIKGPGGALYGQGGTGGVINVTSVQAGSRPMTRFAQTIGSFDFSRTEFLWSGPLVPSRTIGFALPLSYQTGKSNAMYYKTSAFVMNPALTLKLGSRTTLLAAIESRFSTRDNIRNFFLTDNTLAPNGQNYGTLIAGRPGTARVLTTPNQRDFRFEGPDTFRKERTYVRTRPEPVRNTAPSLTAIWLPFDWLRLYANSMSSIDVGPAYSAYDGNGSPLAGAVVRNAEAGLRLDVLKSKLLVNLVMFQMSDGDRPISFGSAIQNLLVSPTGSLNNSGFSSFVKTTTKSTGFDLKVDYVPLRNLRFNIGVSKNDVQITAIEPFATPANPDPIRLAAQRRFVAAGGASSQYLGKPSTDISKYTGSAFVRYEFNQGFLKNTWVMLASKHLGKREAELISVSTATGDITVDRRLVPTHYLFDLNLGYRRKIGRFNTHYQVNVSNVANDDDFYGAVWQTGRTYRFTAGLTF